MRPPAWVGNDVVDLGDPRTHGRSSDERFVARVYDNREQRAIRDASEPDLELWCRWAAKETAFKVVSKVLGEPPPFVHRRFRVEWRDGTQAVEAVVGDPDAPVRRGLVVYEAGAGPDDHSRTRLETPVVVHLGADGALHAVGFATGADGSDAAPDVSARVASLDAEDVPWRGGLEELTPRLSPREVDAVYSRASAAVRLAARADLAGRLGLEERRLEIVCAPGPTSQRPPRVLIDGAPSAADVSLSHDGRWIGWAICLPRVSP